MSTNVQPHATSIVQAVAPNRWALAWHLLQRCKAIRAPRPRARRMKTYSVPDVA